MKDKKKNTSAFSIFGNATVTSANGSNSNAISKVTSTISIDVAGLIAKGKELLEDKMLDTSSGKLKFFQAQGKEILKEKPELAKQFEQATNTSGFYKMADSENPEIAIKHNQERSHMYALDAVKRGIEFLEMLL